MAVHCGQDSGAVLQRNFRARHLTATRRRSSIAPARRAAHPAATAALLFPGQALAHAFGERYDLPVPLWLFLTGAGAVVGLSFVLFALGTKPAALSRFEGIREADAWLRCPPARALGIGVRWASVILFSFLCYAGFAGTQAPTQNILPTFLWVGLWVGLAY
ncbi:MAG: hypothetical protein R3174_15575, partial [Gammaproteobacteria bacterium]|nr:hypothetical protein [Gammaproteobacteria bacterium]